MCVCGGGGGGGGILTETGVLNTHARLHEYCLCLVVAVV